jgi:hypothetical protein
MFSGDPVERDGEDAKKMCMLSKAWGMLSKEEEAERLPLWAQNLERGSVSPRHYHGDLASRQGMQIQNFTW